MKSERLLVATLVTAGIILGLAIGFTYSQGEPATVSETSSTMTIPTDLIGFVDGDTVFVGDSDIRYIGIDTPEMGECFSVEAAQRNVELLRSVEHIRFEGDVSNTDIYNRMLRHPWAGSRLISEVLVREGYATVMTVPPDTKYEEQLLDAERDAREHERGLWSECRG